MGAHPRKKGSVAFSARRLVIVGTVLALLGSGAGVAARADDRAAARYCASDEKFSFTVEHQESIRVCTAIPLHLFLWNRSEQLKTVLDKVVVRSASRKNDREIHLGNELPPAAGDLDRFCRECIDAPTCGDAEPCGDLHAALQSSGFDLTVDVPLAAEDEGVTRENACAGERIEIEAHLVVGDAPVVLRRTLTIQEGAGQVAPSAAATPGADAGTIVLAGPLPHPAGWFAGDQHSHTSYEKDSGICIWEWPDTMAAMIGAALTMDLDWQVFTDHSFGIDGTIWNSAYNECATYNSQHPGDSYRCLYGEEVSAGNRSGQFTISHLLQLPKNADNVGYYADGCGLLCNNCKAEQTVVNDINNKGGMSFINHPYDTDFSWANWSVTGYRGLEVLNSVDGAWGAEDESSFTKWKDLLSSGRNVVGLSDSDAHYATDVGHAFTYCRLAEMSTAAIRTALAEGRCVFGNGPLVNFGIEGQGIGDTLAACPGTVTLSIDAYRGDGTMGYLDSIGVYVNGSLRDTIPFAADLAEFHGTRQLDLTSADRYLYLGVQNRGAARTTKAWTNPLWLSVSPDNGPDADGDTYTTCENDCNDGDPAVHPGAPELCDLVDNDCDGATDEGFAVPAGATGLLFEANKQTMGWSAVLLADRYDVVGGDLLALLSSGGDFTSTVTSCIENDGADALAGDPLEPGPGQGFYYLVRAQAACKSGTFNSEPPGQAGDRDTEIAASSHACP